MTTPIPNSLSITLLTKVPGYQKVSYKPSISIPDDDKSDIVYLNPLIKLNKSAVNKIPQNTIKQFFSNFFKKITPASLVIRMIHRQSPAP